MQVILKKTASIIVVLFPFLGFFQKQMVILGFHTGGLIIKVKGYFLAMYRGGQLVIILGFHTGEFILKVTKLQSIFLTRVQHVVLFHFFCSVKILGFHFVFIQEC